LNSFSIAMCRIPLWVQLARNELARPADTARTAASRRVGRMRAIGPTATQNRVTSAPASASCRYLQTSRKLASARPTSTLRCHEPS
jgi:hypothetical protein